MTWRSATRRGDRPAAHRRDDGIALVAALLVMSIMAAIGLCLAFTTALEPLAAANYETSWAARLAAESGVAVAAHELAGIADWDLVLGGAITSAVLDQSGVSVELPGGAVAGLPELTNLAACGHTSSCTDAEVTAITVDRPWGPNNPRWRIFGHGRLGALVSAGSGVLPIEVVVWVGDDPADADGDPFHDTALGPAGEWQLGACALAVRAEAFAPRLGHRTILAIVGRPAPGCGPGARLVSWHELN